MKKVVTLILVFFVSNCLFAQAILIDGENTKRKLIWDDFSGKPDKSSEYQANTYWDLNYRFESVRFLDDVAIIKGLEVPLEFNKKFSWLKKGSGTIELLKHEQGHFDIGILCQKEFLTIFKTTKFFKSTYTEVLQDIFNRVMKKYIDMGTLYDNETEHSKNVEAQIKWNIFFESELNKS